MRIYIGFLWGVLAFMTGLVNVVSAVLGVRLPAVDLEELGALWGEHNFSGGR